MTREEAHKILSSIWPDSGGTVSWDDLIPVAEEIARLRAGREWQPISSAPKDREILVGHFKQSGEWCQAVAFWNTDWDWWEIAPQAHMHVPSHWQPLPEPPQ